MYGITPVQLMHVQTDAVAYKPTRPPPFQDLSLRRRLETAVYVSLAMVVKC